MSISTPIQVYLDKISVLEAELQTAKSRLREATQTIDERDAEIARLKVAQP